MSDRTVLSPADDFLWREAEGRRDAARRELVRELDRLRAFRDEVRRIMNGPYSGAHDAVIAVADALARLDSGEGEKNG